MTEDEGIQRLRSMLPEVMLPGCTPHSIGIFIPDPPSEEMGGTGFSLHEATCIRESNQGDELVLFEDGLADLLSSLYVCSIIVVREEDPMESCFELSEVYLDDPFLVVTGLGKSAAFTRSLEFLVVGLHTSVEVDSVLAMAPDIHKGIIQVGAELFRKALDSEGHTEDCIFQSRLESAAKEGEELSGEEKAHMVNCGFCLIFYHCHRISRLAH